MRACLMILVVAALAACATKHDEQRVEEPVICGGQQGLACGAGEYCAFAPTGFCGVADQTGICMPRPQACTLDYRPICGCDGETYANSCEAAAQGVSVASLGECQP